MKEINESGVLGGRGLGLLLNMFVLEYIFEFYKNRFICIALILFALCGLIVLRKSIRAFGTENIWNIRLLGTYVSFNALFSGLGCLIGYFYSDMLLVQTDYIPVWEKVILCVLYLIVFWVTELPSSPAIRFSSRNEYRKME